MTSIEAFRLEKDTIGGKEWAHDVFTDREVAELEAKARTAEWVAYKVHPVSVRVISETEGAIGHDLVFINRTTADEKHRQRGLAKLTLEEKRALGLE